ncbi:MAG: class I SAM-dependent methyltransferase [Candidatus Obscuribacterales bacterium]|nr:class I SAM-dependent methyltransferase [Candidatus Obscuribacterales bacterium]
MINKKAMLDIIPVPLLRLLRGIKGAYLRIIAGARSNADIFAEIYARNRWGGKPGEYYSGTGSDSERSGPYIAALATFIESNGIREVVDIGCGDFRVGAELLQATSIEKYIGIDVVGALIEHNRERFANERIKFECLDACRSELPAGELCILRQVLQHLSNSEIKVILQKVRANYRFVLITEHHPIRTADFKANRDLVHGASIRNKIQSGVFPQLPPFDFPDPEILVEVEAWNCPEEKIVTMLFRF